MDNIETTKYREAIRQSDAIFSFEGFSPTPDRLAIDDAILAGRVSSSQALVEMRQYLVEHKSFNGFVATRHWI